MKKLLVLFIFILFSIQVYAERHYELVDIINVTENNFTYWNGAYYRLQKPNCKQGGIPAIDAGTIIATGCSFNRSCTGIIKDLGDQWEIYFGDFFQKISLTIKTYCSYPIQCIKQ